jgi:hypothetical protein
MLKTKSTSMVMAMTGHVGDEQLAWVDPFGGSTPRATPIFPAMPKTKSTSMVMAMTSHAGDEQLATVDRFDPEDHVDLPGGADGDEEHLHGHGDDQPRQGPG